MKRKYRIVWKLEILSKGFNWFESAKSPFKRRKDALAYMEIYPKRMHELTRVKIKVKHKI